MIAILILGIGLLGIASMQATALRNGQSSLERSQAVIQSYAMLDLLRANRANAIAGYYNTSGGGAQCTSATPSSGSPAGQQAAQTEVNQWLASLKQSIGTAADQTTCGRVSCAATTVNGGTCTVMIQWDDSRASTSNTDGAASQAAEGGAARQVVTVVAL